MVQLKRLGSLGLYAEEVPGETKRCVFFVPKNTTSAPTLALDAAVQAGGLLILTPSTDAFGNILAAGARILGQVVNHAAIAWYGPSDVPPENARRLEIDLSGRIRKCTAEEFVEKAIGDAERVRARLSWGTTASIADARVEVRGDALSLQCMPGAKPLRCMMQGVSFELARQPLPGKVEELAVIAFDGTLQSGGWRFGIAASDAVAALRHFIPGMSYVYEADYGTLASESFSLIDLDAAQPVVGALSLEVAVNAYHADARGNYLELKSADKTPMALVSNFTTTRGNQVKLTATSARMQFTPNPNGASFTLIPVGIFSIEAPGTSFDAIHGTRTVDLLLGSAGTEYVTFATAPGHPELPHAIEFVPECKAFALKNSGGYELTARAQTAYVRPSWGPEMSEHRMFSYVTQSEETPLFRLPEAGGGHLFVQAAGLPFAPKPRALEEATGLMPWLPMRNAKRDTATRFDRVVIGAERRRIAEGAQRPRVALDTDTDADADADEWTVTSQGFLVQVAGDGRWQRIKVAQGDDITVEFERPDRSTDWFLEQALSRPSSFLVATRSPKASHHRSELGMVQVGAKDWKLSCDLGSIAAAGLGRRPILIAKFGPGTIVDLMKNTEQWSLPAIFNASPSQAQADVASAIKALETLSRGQSPLDSGANLPEAVRQAYGRLLAKLSDPSFNGIVVFNGESFLKELPSGVAALGSGESPRFPPLLVPVMGVDISRIDKDLSQKPSVFGAIHYYTKEEVKDPGAAKGYALKLRNLDTHIENTTLTSFVAKAQLWTSSLMGDALEGLKDKRPIVEIEGHYNTKSAEGSGPQYIIQAVGSQKLKFSSPEYFQSIELTRLEVISRRPTPDVVTGRISLRGSVGLGTSLVEFCGVRSVKFEDLALTITQKGEDTSFGFDAGAVSVDWDSDADSAVKGWLSFPSRLSGFRWSGMGSLGGQPDAGALRWPDIGFTGLDLDDIPGLPDLKMTAPSFDFGLEFDLNLGGFGGQTDAAKLLRAKFLLGWNDFRRGLPDLTRYGLGFRFEGGSTPLDVGIQGIFRLRAKSVTLKTYDQGRLIGFGLDEPRLDIAGYEIPKKATLQLAIVVEAQKPSTQPTWIFVSRGFEATPLTLDYFAIGQNVRLLEDGVVPSNTQDAVTKSGQWVKDSFPNDLGRLRPGGPQGGKWGLAASGTLKNIVAFDLIFMDTVSMYGLHVEIPDEKPFFSADVLYRKISEDLGMFSVEIDPKLPLIEFGVGSLTLPVLGFDRLTNGGGGINLGFNGNDFSKAGTFQAIPFLGSLGFKAGQYTGLSSAFLLAGASADLVKRYEAIDLSPVHELHLSFRLGFGKEIRQSIFRAGVSLTVYGLFQGALAKVNKPPVANPIKQYMKIAGAVGVLLEIFGSIDFALISASVSIRVWVEVGFIVETWQPIEVYGEAGVSVYVKFVIARFKVFGRSFEIAIHYSFATTVRFGHTLGTRLGGNPPPGFRLDALEAPTTRPQSSEPIDWEALELDDGVVWTLPLVPSMDVVCDEAGAASVLPLLALHNPAPHGRDAQDAGHSAIDLALGLLRWALRLHLKTPAADPVTVTRKQMEALQARLRSAHDAPASRWVARDLGGSTTRPLDVVAIKRFFAKNCQFLLMDAKAAKVRLLKDGHAPPGDSGDIQAIVFPWLREVEVHAVAHANGKTRLLRAFHEAGYEVVTPAWEARLKEALRKGRPEYPKENALLLADDEASATVAANKSALDLMLEDWTGAVLEALVGDALTLLPQTTDQEVPFSDIIAKLRERKDGAPPPLALQAVQRASSVLLHGLRVPAINGAQWESVTALAELDVPFSNGSVDALHDDENVGLAVAGQPGWLKGAASLEIAPKDAATKAGKLVASLAARELRLQVTLDEHQSNKDDQGQLAVVAGPGSKPVLLKAQPNTAALLMPMPQRLRDEAEARGGRLDLAFRRFVSLADPASNKEPPSSPSSSAISFAGLFSLRVRKVRPAVGSLPGLVEISGAGEEARRILKSWDQDALLAPNAFLFVVPGAKSSPPTLISGGVRFFTTNLSTEANPDSNQLRPAGSASPVLADISDVAAMRQFLWMASVVNDAGFFASIDSDAWPALDKQLFSQSTVADASVAWVRPVFDANGFGFVARGETLVVTQAQDFPADLGIRIGVPGIVDQVSGAPAGFVSLVVSRPYQENDPANPDDEVELLSRYVFLEHSVRVDGATRLALDESPVMPPAPPEGLDLAASFQVQRATELRYYVSVPLGKFLPAAAIVSGPTVSPYIFVGKDLDTYLSFGLRDASGHRFPGKIDTAWASKTVLFRNPLPQLGVLPGLTMTWTPITKGKLRAKLVFVPPDDFTAGEGLIGAWRDLKFNFDTKLVTLHAEVGLRDGARQPSEDIVLESDVCKRIGDWVEFVLRDHAASPCEIDLALPADKISAAVQDLPREVLVRLRLTRTAHVDPEASRVNPAVAQTVATLRPGVAKETKEGWQRFAEKMEQSYPDTYIAKMSYGASAGASGSSVWIGNAKSLDAPFAGESEYGLQSYAPAPLAKQFRSGRALMLNERGEEAIDAPTKEAGDIDLDLLLEQSLDMFEDVLGPSVSGKLAAHAPDTFNGIMDSKKSIVGSMASRLRQIEARTLGIPLPQQVTRRFHSLAAKDLRNIYRLGAIAYVTRAKAIASVSTPRIYGSVSAGGSSSQVEWSKVRMPLQADSFAVVSATWKPEVRPASTLFPSTVVPSHVEWPWPESEGEEYVPSRWLELLSVRSRRKRRIKLAAESVPLPLRRLPATPKIYAHRASPGTSAPASLADLRRWTYQLDAGVPSELQDTIEVELDYVPRTTAALGDRVRTLFDALVGISHHREVLAAYITLLKNDTVSTADVVRVAPYLANFLADLADRLASHPATPSRLGDLAQADMLSVKLGMPANDTELRYTLKTSGKRAAKVELALQDAGASSFAVVPNPILGPGKTLYRASDEVDRARRGVGGLSGRRTTVTGLDILNQPVLMPLVRAFRNRDLGGVVVHDDFILESQETKTDTELVAQLCQPSGRLLISSAGKTLADQLSAFAGELFGNDGSKVSVDADASLVIPMDAAVNQLVRPAPYALKSCRSDNAGSFAAAFAKWGDELRAAIGSAPVDPQTPPQGIELSVTVYADYAGDLSVLVLPRLWINWRHLAPQQPRLMGLPLRTWANDHELADWLYWLTGGWQPNSARGSAEITALRRKVAKLLKSSPCYNGAPGDNVLALQERDGARMAAAWRECKQIAFQDLRAVKLGTRPLGWFIAPWNVAPGEQDFRALRQLLGGPLLPPVDWDLITHGPIDTAWRAAHDPFSGRKVTLVEVVERHPETKPTTRRQR
jgi:hypothetical protein